MVKPDCDYLSAFICLLFESGYASYNVKCVSVLFFSVEGTKSVKTIHFSLKDSYEHDCVARHKGRATLSRREWNYTIMAMRITPPRLQSESLQSELDRLWGTRRGKVDHNTQG